MHDASNPRHIRKQLKALKAQDAQDAGVIQNIMSGPAGRQWMHNLLAECHVFHSSFNDNHGRMSFNEGERNVGLRLFNAIVRHAPEPYLQMMREANDREQINASGSDDNRRSGPEQGNGRDLGGTEDGRVESEYEPGADAD